MTKKAGMNYFGRIIENGEMMRKGILLCVLFLVVAGARAQTLVYTHAFKYHDSLKVTVNDGRVYDGRSSFVSDAVLTVEGNTIYRGNSTSAFDVMYTLRDGKLYIGDSTFSSDLLYTIKQGRIYKGESTFSMDCLYRYDMGTGQVYKGDSTFGLDIVLYMQGESLSSAEICAVLLAMGWL
jgi:hypothetical protein